MEQGILSPKSIHIAQILGFPIYYRLKYMYVIRSGYTLSQLFFAKMYFCRSPYLHYHLFLFEFFGRKYEGK